MYKIYLVIISACFLCLAQAGYSQADTIVPLPPSVEDAAEEKVPPIETSGETQSLAAVETDDKKTVELNDSSSESKSAGVDRSGLLKWIFAIIGSLLGALLAMLVGILIFNKKVGQQASEEKNRIGEIKADYERRLKDAEVTIENVKEGVEGVKLLDAEALRLLREFETGNKSIYAGIVQAANTTLETTDQFKQSLRQSLGPLVENINSVMERSADDSKRTKEHLDIIIPMMQKNEAENEALRKGMNMQLVGPLLESFFKLRDELTEHILHSQQRNTTDEDLRFLMDLEVEIGHSIHGVSLDEIRFRPNDDMRTVPVSHWKDFGVAKKTDQQELHGRCADTKSIGYIQRDNTSESPHVVRKATVQLYSFDSGLKQEVDHTNEAIAAHVSTDQTSPKSAQAINQ